MSLVLDSSAVLAWIYSEETTPAIEDVLNAVVERGAWVPSLWRLEVANVLNVGIRRERHDAAFRDASLLDLSLMAIRVDPETDSHAWGATLRLAEEHSLTLYDASYLELSLRRRIPLATLDNELRRAAGKEMVRLLGI